MQIKDIIKNIKWIKLIIGLLIGAVGGYLYYYYVGCASGTCAIQSDPYKMTAYGMMMGAILFFDTKKIDEA